MDFFDAIMDNAEFEDLGCSETTDENKVTEDTTIEIKVIFKPLGYYTVVEFYCEEAVSIGSDLGDEDVWLELRWHALELLDIPKFSVGKV